LIYGDSKDAKGPIIQAQTNRNAVLVHGTKEQIEEVRKTIQALGDAGANNTLIGNTRIINLGSGSGAAVAEALEKLLQGMGKFDVKVQTPGGATEKKEEKKEKELVPTPPKEKPPGTSDQRKSQAPWRKTGVLVAAHGYVGQLVDPQENKGKDKKDDKDKKKSQITITASGNRIIIHSDDPDAMRMANEVLDLLLKSQGDGDFEVIKLKKANAVDVARVIDEAYNGVRQQQQGGFRGGFGGGGFNGGFGGGGFRGGFGGGGFGGFGGGGFGGFGGGFAGQGAQQQPAPAAGGARTDSGVRVVADPGTNS